MPGCPWSLSSLIGAQLATCGGDGSYACLPRTGGPVIVGNEVNAIAGGQHGRSGGIIQIPSLPDLRFFAVSGGQRHALTPAGDPEIGGCVGADQFAIAVAVVQVQPVVPSQRVADGEWTASNLILTG